METDMVPLNRLFEAIVRNPRAYDDPYTDIELTTTFTAPSGKETEFWGFYDGDGDGGQSGHLWKFRFSPTEVGPWKYHYAWSDGTPGGEGQFECVQAESGKGVLQPYLQNSHWLAYNGVDPVLLRSYYVGGTIVSPVEWAAEKVYRPLIERGYNHVVFNQMLPVEWVDTDSWLDAPSVLAKYLFEDNNPRQKMNLDVWANLEAHIRWLNDRDIGVYVFQGFDGKHKYTHVSWERLADDEKDFFVRYVCSRLAPFANIAGWTYTWETAGDGPELELMALLDKYDPWGHLRTYEAQYPKTNHFEHPLYTWAAVENHDLGDTHGAESHHTATLAGYADKPVLMLEGNGLWKAFWKADEDTIRRAAWAVVTAGGSFTWDWTIPNGSEPAYSYEMMDSIAVTYIDILNHVMLNDLVFYRMIPRDDLLGAGQPNTYCLAEEGQQYLVWKQDGGEFWIDLPVGMWHGVWVDTKTNARLEMTVQRTAVGMVKLITPDENTDWALIMKRA
jgi:hypothetical protein